MMTEKIEEIIEKSGNNFHYKVVEFLRNAGWYVLVSPYYNDNFTDKPREIDIIAEKEYSIGDGFGGQIGTLICRFFIECKHIKDDTVFWFDKKNIQNALKRVLSTTPLGDPHNWSMTDKHRYLEDVAVAKLFASSSDKNFENEVMHKAIIQSLNSMVYYEDSSSFVSDNHYQYKNIKTVLNYPIIICNNFNNFWQYNILEKNKPDQIKDNFQLEVQYAYFDKNKGNKNEYFLLDIVSFENLDTFIKNIEEKDINAIQEKIWWEEKTKT